jgi:protein-disulfide isomerase
MTAVKKQWITAILDHLATLAVILAASLVIWRFASDSFVWRSRATAPAAVAIPTSPLSLDSAKLRGSATAPVVLLLFSEFECPFCRKLFQEVLPTLDKEYVATGRILVAFRHLPLTSIHANAMPAAIASECAQSRGRFWDFHDRLFGASEKLGSNVIAQAWAGVDLPHDGLGKCLRSDAARKQVDADVREAERLGVKSTPTSFVGRRLPGGEVAVNAGLSGAQPIARFRELLDTALNQK